MALASSSTVTSNVITLRGSTDIVTEFFKYSVNNILYQRGIYPPESFKKVSHYGLSMMITTDEGLLNYLSNILKQLEGMHDTPEKPILNNFSSLVWLLNKNAQKLILVVKGIDSGDTLERWVFDCDCSIANDSENTVK